MRLVEHFVREHSGVQVTSIPKSHPPLYRVRVPARLDMADTDFPKLYMQFSSGSLSTVNIAISLRTEILYRQGKKGISVYAGGCMERGNPYKDPRLSKFPYIWYVLRFLSAPNGVYEIKSEIPQGAGLGGSSALVVGLLFLVVQIGRTETFDLTSYDIASDSNIIENAIGRTSAGLQDALAAVWGFANQWLWGLYPSEIGRNWRRVPIWDHSSISQAHGKFVLAFTGSAHLANLLPGRKFINLSKSDRSGWQQMATFADSFARALHTAQWEQAAQILNKERNLRLLLTRETPSERLDILIRAAEREGAGVRFSGSPTGGTAWATGPSDIVTRVFEKWTQLTSSWTKAFVFRPSVSSGVSIEIIDEDDLEFQNFTKI